MSYLDKTLLVFDWDGTLFDSMATKFTNFAQALAEQVGDTESVDLIRADYQSLSGIPRQEIYNEILKRHEWTGSADYDRFNEILKEKNLRMLPSCEMFPDAVEFIQWLTESGHSWVISSSSPDEELQTLSESAIGSNDLSAPHLKMGSKEGFSKGIGHITHIKKSLDSLRKTEILFIGDDMNDYLLSKEAGVECRLINREGRDFPAEIPQIRSLLELKD